MSRRFVPDARVSYSDNAALDYTSDLALSGWIYIDSVGSDEDFVRKDLNYIFRVGASNLIWLWWDGGGLLYGLLGSLPTLTAWHQVIAETIGDSPVDLYIDGVAQGLSPTFFGGGGRDLTQPLDMGGAPGGEDFPGQLAEFGWYTSVSSGDITDLQTKKPSAVGSPNAYIAFDANINEALIPLTGTANTSGGGSITVTDPPPPFMPISFTPSVCMEMPRRRLSIVSY
jgi:hypothetical protein